MRVPDGDEIKVSDPFANEEAFRDTLVDRLVRQLFGPLPEAAVHEQTETLTISPLQLYATGILFPQRMIQGLLEDSQSSSADDEREVLDDPRESIDVSEGRRGTSAGDPGEGSAEREPINLANEFSPSAAGISFCLAETSPLRFRVSYGAYDSCKVIEAHPRAGDETLDGKTIPSTRDVQGWQRRQFNRDIDITVGMDLGSLPRVPVDPDGRLSLCLTVRRRADNRLVVSAMLVNEIKNDGVKAPSCEDVFFQTSLTILHVERTPAFFPIDRSAGCGSDDPELASLELLFRHRRAFALGHGTAGDWNRAEAMSEAGATDWVGTAAVPSYQLKPIKPRRTPHGGGTSLRLSMGFLSEGEEESTNAIPAALEALAQDYEDWITAQAEDVARLTGSMKDAADANLSNCRRCLVRMRTGITLLRREPMAMLAFRLMNKAMFVQQHHSRLSARKLGSQYPESAGDGHDKEWYPFQIGFILMNLTSAFDPEDPERRLVDLIWFPTGGGKTEAYLGLTAFTIILGRLKGEKPGTNVLMRYTLRLLTAQQFQRATALVLAIEAMRRDREMGCDLGTETISIGLWVGKSLSPNARDDARAKLRALQKDKYATNPFQVLQCPWCGVDFTDRAKLGYVEVRQKSGAPRSVGFVCPDDECRFSSVHGGLPVLVIDEDIYAAPPSVLIGTVDKFAQVAWEQRVGSLFGLGSNAPPPALIIQDELHLISGPLGTIVGLYETAIDRLCSRDGYIHKIVASTATIRRAHEQCWDLYARECFEFPPQAIRAGESYFAFEDGDAPGRRYVGFMGNAVKSHQTSLVRACSPLLQGVCYPLLDDQEREKGIADSYGTLVWYFNSLRELGHAATLCVGDIPEFLKGFCHRQKIAPGDRRYIREIVELTSRRGAEEIPSILQQLEVPWQMKPTGPPPVDILLATNMIAVGVDVSRLGLMVMSGQPKGTSEYIQASSRVGRSGPGLVVTVYTQTKSRDRSHYERFVAYHQSLYRHVEPTSVTPFSPQARERGMRGVLVGMARLLGGVDSPDLVSKMADALEEQVEAILQRAALVDEGEEEEARAEIEGWIKDWRAYSPPAYGRMGGTPTNSTLMYPYGAVPDETFQREAWPVLTSMRNVDGTSSAQVLNIYPTPITAED